MLRLVAATRHNPQEFLGQTLLGRSLSHLEGRKDVRAELAFVNSCGLPEVYNDAISRADGSDAMVFVHDDVWLNDWFLPERVSEALERFDLIGVAGNRRRLPGQPSWAFIDAKFTWDASENLSGSVAHALGGSVQISRFGESAQPVRLLDGVFLAARVETLRQAGVQFDPRFRFHFYDLDLCRTCEQAGLRLGTWPIAITHGSGGQFGNPEWRAAYAVYLAKWNESAAG